MYKTMRTYEEQLWDPSKWTVRTFHDNTGTILVNAVTAAVNTILWTAGSPTVNTTLADLRPANLMFAFVCVDFNFNHLTNYTDISFLDTFIQLPQSTHTVLNGTEGNNILTSFLGRNDITSYSKDKFCTLILGIMGQLLPADLAIPQFGQPDASLDV